MIEVRTLRVFQEASRLWMEFMDSEYMSAELYHLETVGYSSSQGQSFTTRMDEYLSHWTVVRIRYNTHKTCSIHPA